MIDPYIPYILALVFGGVIGSFLNVVIYRLPLDKSIVSPPSACPKCGHAIRPWDNVPVLSWMILLGKCRDCRNPISIRYPLVELATALLSVGMVWWNGVNWQLPGRIVFIYLMICIMLIDWDHLIIPDELSLGGTVVGIGVSFLPGGVPWLNAILSAAGGFCIMYLIAYLGRLAFRREAMGGGDVKLMAMLGAFLGWKSLLLTLMLASAIGAVCGGLMLATRFHIGERKEIPFGPYLCLGALIAMTLGERIWSWYQGFIVG